MGRANFKKSFLFSESVSLDWKSRHDIDPELVKTTKFLSWRGQRVFENGHALHL